MQTPLEEHAPSLKELRFANGPLKCCSADFHSKTRALKISPALLVQAPRQSPAVGENQTQIFIKPGKSFHTILDFMTKSSNHICIKLEWCSSCSIRQKQAPRIEHMLVFVITPQQSLFSWAHILICDLNWIIYDSRIRKHHWSTFGSVFNGRQTGYSPKEDNLYV